MNNRSISNNYSDKNVLNDADDPSEISLVRLEHAETTDGMNITLRFSERLSPYNIGNVQNYILNPFQTVNSAWLDKGDPTIVHLVTSLNYGVSYGISVNGLSSITGEGMDEEHNSAPVVRSTISSIQLKKAHTSDSKLVTLVFNEVLQSTEANNKDNYVFQPGATVISAELDTNNLTLVHLTTSLDPDTSYAVRAQNLVSASGQDTMDPQLSSRVVIRSHAPLIQSVQLNSAYTSDNKLVTLAFSETLRSAEANNKDNYVFQPGATVISAELDTTNLTRVHLTTSLDPNTSYAVRAQNLVSASGQDTMDPQLDSRVVLRHIDEQIQTDR